MNYFLAFGWIVTDFIFRVKESKKITLKMEALVSIETPGTAPQTTRRRISEYLYLQQCCCENVK
jgi:hypothetical protein